MKKVKIGLLPFYLKQYDKKFPDAKKNYDLFCNNIEAEFKKRGADIVRAPFCSDKEDFNDSINFLGNMNVNVIVTLHLTYSPSLESIGELLKVKIPIIILDTTPEYYFGPRQSPEKILYNHGIHGVQDLCNLLKRNNKEFVIEAGHYRKSDVLDRVISRVKAIMMCETIREIRVGIIGTPFAGMGDIMVPFEKLKEKIGIKIITCTPEQVKKLMPTHEDKEVLEEMHADYKRFKNVNIEDPTYQNSIRTGIAVRRLIKILNLDAFSMNFLNTYEYFGVSVPPFLEASKAMSRGIGYAGEGDALSAALTGVILKINSETTFVEMFCPSWRDDSIFLSHSGELNIKLIKGKPRIVNKELGFSDKQGFLKPVIAAGCLKAGKATLVNLAPVADGFLNLIISKVTVLNSRNRDNFRNQVHGWIKPGLRVSNYLEQFSMAGGTHHSTLVYGDMLNEIYWFGRSMGWNVINI